MDKGKIGEPLFTDFSAVLDLVDHIETFALWFPRNCTKLGEILSNRKKAVYIFLMTHFPVHIL